MNHYGEVKSYILQNWDGTLRSQPFAEGNLLALPYPFSKAEWKLKRDIRQFLPLKLNIWNLSTAYCGKYYEKGVVYYAERHTIGDAS